MSPNRIISTINEMPSAKRKFHNLGLDARRIVLIQLVEAGNADEKTVIKTINRVRRNSTKKVAKN